MNDLAKVLHQSENLGDETKELYKNVLTIYIKAEGPNGSLVMEANSNLGND
jgi:hypothetical protein